jgi:hypothetical protein
MNYSQINLELKNWYILRGETQYGPFEYGVMIRMVQNHEIQDYNYVWAPHLEGWQMLGECVDFSKDRLALLIRENENLRDEFSKREAARADIKSQVLGHNGTTFFDGECTSISENGALVLINTPLLLPDDQVVIHFSESVTFHNGFKVLAQVVRKNYTKQRLNTKSALQYAVRFLQVQTDGLDQIKNLFKS